MEQNNINADGAIIEMNGNKYVCVGPELYAEIAYFGEDGKPVVKTRTITKEEGFDENGIPKRSVEVHVPCIKIGMSTGEVS